MLKDRVFELLVVIFIGLLIIYILNNPPHIIFKKETNNINFIDESEIESN